MATETQGVPAEIIGRHSASRATVEKLCEALGLAEKSVQALVPEISNGLWTKEEVLAALESAVGRGVSIAIISGPTDKFPGNKRLLQLAAREDAVRLFVVDRHLQPEFAVVDQEHLFRRSDGDAILFKFRPGLTMVYSELFTKVLALAALVEPETKGESGL